MLAFVRHVARPTGLASMLTDTSSRKDLKIYYDESHEGLFVYGDGRLALQKYRTDGTVEDDGVVPTCTSTASQQEIESLVRLMIQRHFVELPQNGFPDNALGTLQQVPLPQECRRQQYRPLQITKPTAEGPPSTDWQSHAG
jgi:hypothetical protein